MDILSKFISHNKAKYICAPATGKIVHLQFLNDKAFSNKLIGDGLAIEINSNCIYSPCKGKINIIAPTKHAFGIITADGVEILVHIGIQALKPDPSNYTYHIKVGDEVNIGTPIVKLSDKLLKKYNYKIITPIVICNYHNHPIKTMTTASTIKTGKIIYTYKSKIDF